MRARFYVFILTLLVIGVGQTRGQEAATMTGRIVADARSQDGADLYPVEGQLIGREASYEGRYVAVVTQPEDPLQGPKLVVFSSEGRRHFAISLEREPDEPYPAPVVSDATGAVAYGRAARGEVVFLDASGAEINRVDLFEEAIYSLEKSLHVAYSPNGEYVAVSAMRQPAGPNALRSEINAFLYLFRPDGALVWRRSLPEPSLQALAFAPDGGHVAVSTYDAFSPEGVIKRTRLFTTEGDLALSVARGFRHVSFGPSAVLMATNESAAAFTFPGGFQLFSFRPSDDASFILDAGAASTGEAFVVLVGQSRFDGGRFVFERPALVVLDGKGRRTGIAQLDARSARRPELQISPGGPAVNLQKKTIYFSWP